MFILTYILCYPIKSFRTFNYVLLSIVLLIELINLPLKKKSYLMFVLKLDSSDRILERVIVRSYTQILLRILYSDLIDIELQFNMQGE